MSGQELTFASGSAAWLFGIVGALLALVVWHFTWKAKVIARLGDLPLIQRMTASTSTTAQWVKWSLLLVAIALVVAALLRPQYGTREAEIQNRGIDTVIVLDLSKSMMVQDVAPNRLKAAIVELESVLDTLSGGRVALVPFAGTAFTQCLLTTDMDAIRSYLDDLRVEDMPIGGTRIGNALKHALTVFDPEKREPGSDKKDAEKKAKELEALEQPTASHHRAIILVTDGDDHDGNALEVAKAAKDKNVTLFTVGIGTTSSGAPVPVITSEGERAGVAKDTQGKPIFADLNVQLLKDLAETTGGRALVYGKDDVAAGLAAGIDGLEKKEYEFQYESLGEDRFQLVLIPALVLLLVEALLSDRRRRAKRRVGVAT